MNKEELFVLINKMKGIPIVEISNFLPDAGEIPKKLQDVGVETLYDLYYTNIERLHLPQNFPLKKSLALRSFMA